MIGVITSFKGGVSKSSLSREIAYNLNLQLIDCDPYGNQAETVIDENVSIKKINPEHETIKLIDNSIYDFGGFDYTEIAPHIFKHADFIIIPTIPTFSSIDKLIETYENVLTIDKGIEDKICFVITKYFIKRDIEEFKNYIKDYIDISNKKIFNIKASRAYYTAENRGLSIFKISEESKFNNKIYSNHRKELQKIFDFIKSKGA